MNDSPVINHQQSSVGAKIAYKRKNDGFSTPTRTENKRSTTKQKNTKTTKSSAMQVFIESAALYITCLLLPTLAAFMFRLYQEGTLWSITTNLFSQKSTDDDTKHDIDDDSWSNYMYGTAASYLCSTVPNSDSLLHSYVATNWSWCPAPTFQNDSPSCLSPDTQYSDINLIAIMTLLLAVGRLIVVHALVIKPHEQNGETQGERLRRMVRYPSIHLLSSDYGATLTPRSSIRYDFNRRTISPVEQDEGFSDILLPSLSKPENDSDYDQSVDIGMRLEETDKASPFVIVSPETDESDTHQSDAFFRELSQKMKNIKGYNADDDNDDTMLRLNVNKRPSATTLRSNASSRYATAVFRLVFCTVASSLALYYFKDADFWPWYVGGHGHTSNGWNLSGGLSVGGMDSDFDKRNSVLRKYFLWQASYHWHSGAFHIVNLALASLYRWRERKHTNDNSYNSGGVIADANATVLTPSRSSGWAYARSLAQHTLALIMIGLAYIFSSLRRLGAIGMFTFDISSWFLHLLQVFINAPGYQERTDLINRLHKFCVVPTFVIVRFLIWPALWYSMATESQNWLVQLERTLVPGSALAMRIFIHTWMTVLMGYTVVYFHRLLYHPHLQRILPKE